MRKIALILCFVLVVFSFTACSGVNIPLTDEESDAIAQYSAYLILKYDKNKNAERKLLDKKELEDIKKENEEKEKAEASPTPTKGEKPSKATPTPKPNKKNDDPTPVPTQEIKNSVESLSDLYGAKGFEVEYDSCGISDVYSENEYSVFTAKPGEDILFVKFKIKNTGKESKKFVSSDYPVNFTLYCDNGDMIGPSVSMLSNDIQFLNDDIGAGKTFDAVLLFITYEDRNEGGFVVKAHNNEKDLDYSIKLK